MSLISVSESKICLLLQFQLNQSDAFSKYSSKLFSLKNAKALLHAHKEDDLLVNTGKTMYMVSSPDYRTKSIYVVQSENSWT
jgi:hypothetical protein